MKKTLALCVLPFLALPVAMPAFAAPTTVSNIEVKTDLDAIQNPAAARYWSNISADLKDAIAARLVDHIDPAGAKVEIDMMPVLTRRLTIAGSTLRARSDAEKMDIRDDAGRRLRHKRNGGAAKQPDFHDAKQRFLA